MALTKQIIEFPIVGGIDRATHEDLIPNGSFANVVNAEYNKSGALSKRKGSTLIGQLSTTFFEQLYSPQALASYKDELLLIGGYQAYDSSSLYQPQLASLWEEKDYWIRKGNCQPCELTTNKFYTPDIQYEGADIAKTNGYVCKIWQQTGYANMSTESLYVVVSEEATGNIVYKQKLLVASNIQAAEDPKVVAIDNNFVIFFADIDGNDIYSTYMDTTLSYLYLSSITLRVSSLDKSVAATRGAWDVVVASTGKVGYIAWQRTTTDQRIRIAEFSKTGVVSTTSVWTNTTNIAHDGLTLFNMDYDGVNYIMLAYQGSDGSNGKLYVEAINEYTLASIGGVNKLEIYDGYDLTNDTGSRITGIQIARDDASNDLSIGIVFTNSKAYGIYIDSSGLAVFSSAGTFYNSRLASKAFCYKNHGYCWYQYYEANTTQSTYVLRSLTIDGSTILTNPVATTCKSSASVAQFSRNLPNVIDGYNTADNPQVISYTTLLMKAETLHPTLPGYTANSPIEVKVDFAPLSIPYLEYGDNLLIGGGQVYLYDGVNCSELGFHFFPEILVNTSNSEHGGAGVLGISNGTRSYKALYEYIDANGRLYRSAPSNALSVTLSHGSTDQTSTIRVPGLTDCDFTKSGTIRVCLYRTIAGGSVYYKTYFSGLNSKTTYIDIEDMESDSTIADNEILYTTSELANTAPPASNIFTATNDTVFLVPADNPTHIWYSKPLASGLGVEFSESNVKVVNSKGPITGLACQDDKVIIFKEKEIRYFEGPGYDANGTSIGGYSEDILITNETGCIYPSSILTTIQGTYFQSNQGIMLLDRGLNVSYIGSPIDGYCGVNEPVVRAVVRPNHNQVWFLYADKNGSYDNNFSAKYKDWFVYDYANKAWFNWQIKYPNSEEIKDIIMLNNNWYALKSDTTTIYKSSDTLYTDNGSNFSMFLQTPKIHLAGLAGYKRLSKSVFSGEYSDDNGELVISWAKDRNPTAIDLIVKSFSDIQVNNTTTPKKYACKFMTSNQCLSSFQFSINDNNNSGSFVINGLSFEIGVKQGLQKTNIKGV